MAAGQTSVWVHGTANFRRDKVSAHAQSGDHMAALAHMQTVKQTAKDILSPVRCFLSHSIFLCLTNRVFILNLQGNR